MNVRFRANTGSSTTRGLVQTRGVWGSPPTEYHKHPRFLGGTPPDPPCFALGFFAAYLPHSKSELPDSRVGESGLQLGNQFFFSKREFLHQKRAFDLNF